MAGSSGMQACPHAVVLMSPHLSSPANWMSSRGNSEDWFSFSTSHLAATIRRTEEDWRGLKQVFIQLDHVGSCCIHLLEPFGNIQLHPWWIGSCWIQSMEIHWLHFDHLWSFNIELDWILCQLAPDMMNCRRRGTINFMVDHGIISVRGKVGMSNNWYWKQWTNECPNAYGFDMFWSLEAKLLEILPLWASEILEATSQIRSHPSLAMETDGFTAKMKNLKEPTAKHQQLILRDLCTWGRTARTTKDALEFHGASSGVPAFCWGPRHGGEW